MSKRIFTQEQMSELSMNPNVLRCSEKSITYHNDFKMKAVRLYQDDGLSATRIFHQAGFNVNIIGRDAPVDNLKRWRKIFNAKGINGLSIETRGRSGGRPKTNWSDDKEKLKYLEVQVAYLKAENAFLAKLRKKRLN